MDFEKITLNIDESFLGFKQFEFNKTENGIEMQCYQHFRNDYGRYILDASVSENDELYLRLAELLDECGAASWDGFDRTLLCLEGSGFDLKIELGGGKVISARGSNAFPDNFGKFVRSIETLLYIGGASAPINGDVVNLKKEDLSELKALLMKVIKLYNNHRELFDDNEAMDNYYFACLDRMSGLEAESDNSVGSEAKEDALSENERALAEEAASAVFRLFNLQNASDKADNDGDDTVSVNIGELFNDLKYNMLYKDSVPDFTMLTFTEDAAALPFCKTVRILRTENGAFALYDCRKGDGFSMFIRLYGNKFFYSAITDILAKCGALGWDGLQGRRQSILDGTDYDFTLKLSGGKTISASAEGWNSPGRFGRFISGVEALLFDRSRF
ncbi:hypothetical protein IJT93_08990 [bacterium]|nr:hypothetical protein [bacterium]